MLSKDDVLRMILEECDICLHLYGKVPAGGMDYRPTPGQRSTLELLRYLSHCALGGTRAMAEGNWDGYREGADAAASMTANDFPARMEAQKQALTVYLGDLTQEDVETRTATTPIGQEMRLEEALVQLPLKWMVAYRMQLFLHAKQAGNADIWTADCWAGVDMERPEPQPTS